jgi:hypothetical protein
MAAKRLDRSPDACLRRVGTSTRRAVASILATFDRATPSDMEAGATWYADARELALALGERGGWGVEHAAAVISHLSPRTTWTRNVAGATALLLAGKQAPGTIGANYQRAMASLQSETPEDSFSGPKTLRFYRNITGDTEAVTVDVWAARVVGLGEAALQRQGVYDAVEHAYRLAARKRGVTPATMQATTWVVARNGRAA